MVTTRAAEHPGNLPAPVQMSQPGGQVVVATFEWVRDDLSTISVWTGPNADHVFQQMVDARLSDRLMFYITSLADQDVDIQVIGSDGDLGAEIACGVTVGPARKLPAGSGGANTQQIISIGVDFPKDGHPWLGVIVKTLGASPTNGGEVTAWALHREIKVTA